MRRLTVIAWIILLASMPAHSQSNEDVLTVVRANALNIYLDQASWTLPAEFHDSALAPDDKERLIEQWADASADCAVDALERYAESTGTPLSEIVDEDGSFGPLADGATAEFQVDLESCLARAWAAVGVNLP